MTHPGDKLCPLAALATSLTLVLVSPLRAQDHTVLFNVGDPGVTKAVTNWARPLAQNKSRSPITYSWPSWAVGFKLESSTNIVPSGLWISMAAPLTLANNPWQVALTQTNNLYSFRLRR